jgi:hypothetical protein
LLGGSCEHRLLCLSLALIEHRCSTCSMSRACQLTDHGFAAYAVMQASCLVTLLQQQRPFNAQLATPNAHARPVVHSPCYVHARVQPPSHVHGAHSDTVGTALESIFLPRLYRHRQKQGHQAKGDLPC